MVLHSSLPAASAEAHRHDLLVDAERYRTAKAVRAALRRIVRVPDPPPRVCTLDQAASAVVPPL